MNGSQGAVCAELASGTVTRQMEGEVQDIFSIRGRSETLRSSPQPQ